jgi:hypothetical protein
MPKPANFALARLHSSEACNTAFEEIRSAFKQVPPTPLPIITESSSVAALVSVREQIESSEFGNCRGLTGSNGL